MCSHHQITSQKKNSIPSNCWLQGYSNTGPHRECYKAKVQYIAAKANKCFRRLIIRNHGVYNDELKI